MGSRVVEAIIAERMLLKLICGHVRIVNLPQDSNLLRAYPKPECLGLGLLIESSTFPEVSEGEAPGSFYLAYREVEMTESEARLLGRLVKGPDAGAIESAEQGSAVVDVYGVPVMASFLKRLNELQDERSMQEWQDDIEKQLGIHLSLTDFSPAGMIRGECPTAEVAIEVVEPGKDTGLSALEEYLGIPCKKVE